MTTADAVANVVDGIMEIRGQPELLAQLLDPNLEPADQTTQILEYIAMEVIDSDPCDALAAGTFQGLELAMVISQVAEKACQMNGPELESMGAFGPILWMLVDQALKMNLAPLQSSKREEEEEEQDLARLSSTLSPVVAMLRLEVA